MLSPAIKKRLLPYLAILAFVIAKIPYLQYAFYWDESWVYAPAVYLMYAHGPSLMPDAIPGEFSRGHPLLFPMACAAWMKVFGNSHVSMHSFALLISVALAVALYEILLKVFNQRVALLALAMLLFNVFFFVNSGAVLTDITIALLAFLSLYCYVKERYVLTGLFLSMLFFTKESGLVACAVLFMDILLRLVRRKISLKLAAVKSVSVIVPVILLCLFFIAQKKKLGWYVYPMHVSIVNIGIEHTFYNIWRSITILFYDEHVYFFIIALVIFALLAAWKQKKKQYLVVPAYFIVLYACTLIFDYKDLLFYVFAGVSIILAFWCLYVKLPGYDKLQQRFIKLVLAFGIAYLYFSCINFFEGRYLFPVVFLFLIVLLAVAYDFFLPESAYKVLGYGTVVACCLAVVVFCTKDGEMSQFERMDVQQDVVDYFEQNGLQAKVICANSFLERVHLKDANTGFLRLSRRFENVTDTLSRQTEFVIFDSLEPDYIFLDKIKKDSAFVLVHSYQVKGCRAEIYQRK